MLLIPCAASNIQSPNFEVMEGNPLSLHLPWESDHILFDKWRTGSTGYPLIDAAMTQLVQEGFIHHSLRLRVCLWCVHVLCVC